jgi:hypothetical protein
VRLVPLAIAVLFALGCRSEPPGRTFGATCASDDVCGCFEPGVGDDPSCDRGEIEMVCTANRCSLPCTYGAAGDDFCQTHFRPSTHCTFESYCAE